MKNRGLLFGLFGIGALLVILFPTGNTVKGTLPAGSAAVSALVAASAGPTSGGALIERFLGRPLAPADRGPLLDLDVLIATLPDPTDSHLDWSYDSGLEGIRRGFERLSYVLDGYQIPSGRDSLKVGDSKVATHEVMPGVLLFRKQSGDTIRLRVLYLVTELPTSGIYKQAFAQAVRERLALFGSLGIAPADAPPLRVIGPTFSGSARSLRRALDTALAGGTGRAEVVTGSATNPNNRTILAYGDRITFAATVHSDADFDRARDTFLLTKLGIDSSQVAILTESSTEYGAGFGQLGRDTADQRIDSLRFLQISLPVNLTALRREYEAAPRVVVESPIASGGAGSRIPLILTEEDHTRETPAPTSRLTNATMDLVVEQIVATLKTHQIRLVGLMFTDVRDKLFLGERIRTRLRDLQFYTYESNVLFLRPELARSFGGMLVLSTYPLVLDAQAWTGDSAGAERLAFANDGAEGTYNATLLQLGCSRAMTDYGRLRDTAARPPVWLTRVGDAGFIPLARDASTDPTTVTTIDPVTHATTRKPTGPYVWTRSDDASPNCRQPRALSRARPDVPFGMRAAFDGFGLLLLLVAWVVLKRRSLVKAGAERRHGFARLLTESTFQTEVYLFLGLTWLTVGYLAIAASVVPSEWSGGRPRGAPLGTLFWVIASLAAFTMVAVAGAGMRTRRHHRPPRPTAPGLERTQLDRAGEATRWTPEVVIALAGILVVAGLIVSIVGSMQADANPLFLYRISKFADRLSPLTPLLALAAGVVSFAFWSFGREYRLTSATQLETAYGVMPTTPEAPKLETEFDQRMAKAIGAIRLRVGMIYYGPETSAFWFAALAVVFWLVAQIAPTLESTGTATWGIGAIYWGSWILRFGVLATLLAISWTVGETILIWAGLVKFLNLIGNHRIISAFERLPARVARLARMSLPTWQPTTELIESLGSQYHGLLASLRHSTGKAALASTAAGLPTARDLLKELDQEWAAATDEPKALAESLAKPGVALDGEAASPLHRARRMSGTERAAWIRTAEEYVALRIVEYIESVLVQLRAMALFLVVAMILATAFLSSYPFFPAGRVKLVFMFLLLGTVTTMLVIMVKMNRDEVLSRITKTEPGEIDWNITFILNLVVFAVLPLLSLLTAEFPAVRDTIASIAKPLSDAMNRL